MPFAVDRSRARLAAAAGLALALAAQGGLADPVDEGGVDAFLRDYQARLPVLLERYSTNRKISYRYTHYVCNSAMLKEGERLGDVDVTSLVEVITDGRQLKSVILDATPSNRKDTVLFWRPDRRYNVARTEAGFELKDEMISFAKVYQHESLKYGFFAHEPMRAGGTTVGNSLWFDDFGPFGERIEVLGVKPSTWKGQRTIEVRSGWGRQRFRPNEFVNTHLDPMNDMVTLGAETDWITEPVKGSDPPRVERYKLIDEIAYRESEEGFSLPKSSRRTSLYEDGGPRKIYEVEFLTYDRYTPSSEEFQLERPYGLATPPPVPFTGWHPKLPPAAKPVADPPRPQLEPAPSVEPARGRRWLTLVALVSLAAAGTLVVRSRMRRPGQSDA